MCVFFPFILDIKFVGRTSLGHTGAEYHTGFSIHLLSAVLALIFLARRIQPFLSLVDREVEFCVLPGNDLIVLHPLGIFFFFFFFLVKQIPSCRNRTHGPTCQKVTWLPLSYRGDRPDGAMFSRESHDMPVDCVESYARAVGIADV